MLDGVYEFCATVRLLIGGLPADPSTKTTKTISVSPAGSYSGYIGTSIPGAGTINLDPLFDRQHRLEEIRGAAGQSPPADRELAAAPVGQIPHYMTLGYLPGKSHLLSAMSRNTATRPLQSQT